MGNSSLNFIIKDCSISTIATGISAGSLIDIKEKLFITPVECIYYHFWGTRLRPHFVHSGYHNDFAFWVYDVLNEDVLAEKLSILDPLHFDSIITLRAAIAELIDEALDAKASVSWADRNNFFHFIYSKIIVFNTLKKLEKPEDLKGVIDSLSLSSIFYHFVDSRRHTQTTQDDFSIWLESFGTDYTPLIQALSTIDISFLTFPEIKRRLSEIIHNYFK